MKPIYTHIIGSLCLMGLISVPAQTQPSGIDEGFSAEKPGLWQWSSSLQGTQPNISKICVDQDSFERLAFALQMASAGIGCGEPTVHKVGNTTDVDTICKRGKTTQKSHTHLVFDSATEFHGRTDAHISPIIGGYGGTWSLNKGKWLGECPKGARPGDMTMPTGDKVNLLDAMRR